MRSAELREQLRAASGRVDRTRCENGPSSGCGRTRPAAGASTGRSSAWRRPPNRAGSHARPAHRARRGECRCRRRAMRARLCQSRRDGRILARQIFDRDVRERLDSPLVLRDQPRRELAANADGEQRERQQRRGGEREEEPRAKAHGGAAGHVLIRSVPSQSIVAETRSRFTIARSRVSMSGTSAPVTVPLSPSQGADDRSAARSRQGASDARGRRDDVRQLAAGAQRRARSPRREWRRGGAPRRPQRDRSASSRAT